MRRSLILIVFPDRLPGAIFHVGRLCCWFWPRAFSQSSSSEGIPGISVPASQNPFLGSDPEEKVSPRFCRSTSRTRLIAACGHNLGLLLAGDQTETARGERWKELSEMLPNVQARVQENVQTRALRRLGFNKLFRCCSHRRGTTSFPAVIPAFNYFDARASLSQSIFNFKNLEKERAASESVKAAQFSYKDAREMVVLAVGNAYLQAIAASARVETAEAQVKNAQALYDKAADQQKAGLSPGDRCTCARRWNCRPASSSSSWRATTWPSRS